MNKNLYLWIFIGVAIILCGALLIATTNMSDRNRGEIQNPINKTEFLNGEEKIVQPVVPEAVDLTQENIDFEEDASDLADDIVDDASFDDEPSLDSIENEVY